MYIYRYGALIKDGTRTFIVKEKDAYELRDVKKSFFTIVALRNKENDKKRFGIAFKKHKESSNKKQARGVATMRSLYDPFIVTDSFEEALQYLTANFKSIKSDYIKKGVREEVIVHEPVRIIN